MLAPEVVAHSSPARSPTPGGRRSRATRRGDGVLLVACAGEQVVGFAAVGASDDPDADAPTRPSCSSSGCTPTLAGRATARVCSMPSSTRLVAAAAGGLTAWVLATHDATRAFLAAAGLAAGRGAPRARGGSEDGATARELRLRASVVARVSRRVGGGQVDLSSTRSERRLVRPGGAVRRHRDRRLRHQLRRARRRCRPRRVAGHGAVPADVHGRVAVRLRRDHRERPARGPGRHRRVVDARDPQRPLRARADPAARGARRPAASRPRTSPSTSRPRSPWRQDDVSAVAPGLLAHRSSPSSPSGTSRRWSGPSSATLSATRAPTVSTPPRAPPSPPCSGRG